MARVAIVDYKAGNLFSVEQACKAVGLDPVVTCRQETILAADALILPGVGAFGDAIRNLYELDLVSPLRDFSASGKPFMGICLGMQLLFSASEEFGDSKGLDLIEGRVIRFPDADRDGEKTKIPQIGWNRVVRPARPGNAWGSTPLENVRDGEFMYFVHSFYAVASKPEHVLATTEYAGVEYCSAAIKENVFATQFHPEKSADAGLSIYRSWADGIPNGRKG